MNYVFSVPARQCLLSDVAVMTVGVMTVGVMRRPLIFMATTLVSISYKEVMQKKTVQPTNKLSLYPVGMYSGGRRQV
jgi:hypothetical protein